ncbi:MAG: hypothetical protein O3C40_36055, partial [Planctomycetota bacterium]|nr:hypothetical protein [Planctomycetota bacterium]
CEAVFKSSLVLGLALKPLNDRFFLGLARSHPLGSMVGAVLGLLAFILAFTFGMTAARFDSRKGDSVSAQDSQPMPASKERDASPPIAISLMDRSFSLTPSTFQVRNFELN